MKYILLFFVLVFFTPSIFACSIVATTLETAENNFIASVEYADAVIYGKPIAFNPDTIPEGAGEYIFEIQKSWKKNLTGVIRLRIGDPRYDCAWHFILNKSYIIYVQPTTGGNAPFAGYNPTFPWANSTTIQRLNDFFQPPQINEPEPIPTIPAPIPLEPNPPTACDADVKLCDNGSYVARVSPACEFAPCPINPNATDPPANSPPSPIPIPPKTYGSPIDSIVQFFRDIFSFILGPRP